MREENISIKGTSYTCYSIQTLVIGSGAAGLNAAVSLYKQGQKNIAIITEGKTMGTSRNTGSDKQTYYKLTTCGQEADSVRKMAQTLFNGGSMDGDIALVEAALSTRGFFHLVDIGVPFPHNASGEFVGYKTDHDPFRRGTSAGPLTSKFMTEALWKEVELFQIPVFDAHQVIEILTKELAVGKRARGVIALDKRNQEKNEYVIFSADNLVYATGGEAGMYDTSVYPVSQTGSTGTALRAGALGKNLTESQYGIASIKFRWNLSGTYQQVIPRYVSTDLDGNDEQEFLDEFFTCEKVLLTAIFLKGYQWPFDPRKIRGFGSSLIDILVYNESIVRGRRVFVDYMNNPKCSSNNGRFEFSKLGEEAHEYLKNSGAMQDKPIERLAHMNPAAIMLYQNNGIDLYTEKLEIAVCAQHNNGGLSGNHWWESNIKHFFPVGEVNGSHGIYRPGGSALNAGQVGSLRAAAFIAKCYTEEPWNAEELAMECKEQLEATIDFGNNAISGSSKVLDLKKEKKNMQVRMSKYGAHIRSEKSAVNALADARTQLEIVKNGKVDKPSELRELFRLRDLIVSQITYLSAILDFIQKGGRSRGSYLVCDENGEKPSDKLDDTFYFALDDGKRISDIQEIQYGPQGCQISWRKVREIPEDDSWFENVWRAYLQGDIFKI